MKTIQVETYVEASDGEYSVFWNCTPGRAAKLYGPPENCHPAEPAEAEALYATNGVQRIEDVERFFAQNSICYECAEESALIAAGEKAEEWG